MNVIKHKFMQVDQEIKRQEKLLQENKKGTKESIVFAIELLFLVIQFLFCAAALTFAFFGIMAPEYIKPILELFK